MVLIWAAALAGCADTTERATRPAVETPRPSSAVPASEPAPLTTTAAATTTKPSPKRNTATRPAPRPSAAPKPRLKPIVVSEDGLRVEGEFSAPGKLNVGWIEVIELINADKPGRIRARQKPPRTLDFDTQNVKRLRIDFGKSKLSRTKTLIIRPDRGRGIEVSQKRGRVLFFERSSTGRWGIDRSPKKR